MTITLLFQSSGHSLVVSGFYSPSHRFQIDSHPYYIRHYEDEQVFQYSIFNNNNNNKKVKFIRNRLRKKVKITCKRKRGKIIRSTRDLPKLPELLL